MRRLNSTLILARQAVTKQLRARPKFRPRKPVAWRYPRLVENAYARALSQLVDTWWNTIEQIVITRLPEIVLAFSSSESAAVHWDAWPDDVKLVISKARGFILQAGLSRAEPLAAKYAAEVNEQNSKQFRTVIKSSLGIDLYSQEPWLGDEMKAFIQQNVSLIKGLSEETIARVETRIYNAVREGKTAAQIGQSLRNGLGIDKGVFKTIKKRAEFIAVDQVGKLNSQMTKFRQTGLGIKSYFWRTAMDEKVRIEHRAREGKKFFWKRPPEDGHPGYAPRCRCYAEPNVDEVLDLMLKN